MVLTNGIFFDHYFVIIFSDNKFGLSSEKQIYDTLGFVSKSSRKEYYLDFVCFLFVWDLTSHSRIFHSYGDVTITGEGLQILTYARHSWSLSSKRSLACHTSTVIRGIRL